MEVRDKRTDLWWIRDCWSFFVSNLPHNVTLKELHGLFRENDFVFFVFVPKNKVTGASIAFGFVRFKTEWDARKSINLLDGHLVGGKRISVQMVKYENRNTGGSSAQTWRNDNRRGGVPGIVAHRRSTNHQKAFTVEQCGAWPVKEGMMQAVKCRSLNAGR